MGINFVHAGDYANCTVRATYGLAGLMEFQYQAEPYSVAMKFIVLFKGLKLFHFRSGLIEAMWLPPT
jgi:hypothetical protein